jgi:Tat protein secretion system quality control protein TatD with DNase activity
LRRKRNEPAFPKWHLMTPEEIPETSAERMAEITSENAKTFFGIQ